MENNQLELLKELVETDGISGKETAVSRLLKRHLEAYGATISYDNLGSTVGLIRGLGKCKLMLAAHMDEVGFIVKSIDEKGFIRVHPIGGWWPHVIVGQRMNLTTRTGKVIPGVFGSPAPHGMSSEERGKVVDIKRVFFDVGASDKKMAEEAGIRPGDMIAPIGDFTPMVNPDLLLGKAWDDRIGVYVLIEVAKALEKKSFYPNLFFVGTVQEEVGLRGAKTVANKIEPDLAIAIDVTIIGDTPGAKDDLAPLGSGVNLSLGDGSVIGHSRFLDHLEQICQDLNLKYRFDVLSSGGTDSGAIHVSGIGVPTITLSIPSRYIHSANSVVNYLDVEATIKLITEFILRLDQAGVDQIIRGA